LKVVVTHPPKVIRIRHIPRPHLGKLIAVKRVFLGETLYCVATKTVFPLLSCSSSTPRNLTMSNTTYAPSYRPQTSPVAELLRELFAATPLAILLAALKSGR
jgi:hypothetical protein